MQWFQRFLRKNGMVGLMMTILCVVYVLGILVQGVWGITEFNVWAAKSVSLPVHIPTFGKHPWTLLTYWMYTPPLAIFILIADLFLLYTFGNILNAMVGDRRTQGIIFFAILVNAVITLFLCNILPTVRVNPNPDLQNSIFGFASINATLIISCITLVPRYNFRIIRWDVPLYVVGGILLAVQLLAYQAIWTSMGTSMVVGALVGFLWIKVLQTGNDLTSWLHFDLGFDTKDPQRQARVSLANRSRIRVIQANKRELNKKQEAAKPKMSRADRLDELLDKINDVGYAKLSNREKEELKRLSDD